MKNFNDAADSNMKQPNFLENAFKTANEKIESFRSYFEENHYQWLKEIYEEAKNAFVSEEVILLPKTPSMRKRRKKVHGSRKTSRAGRVTKERVTAIQKSNSPARLQGTRASKKAKFADSTNTSLTDIDVDTSLNESVISNCGGRKPRVRKRKSGKPPMATRQSKRIAAKTKIDLTPEEQKTKPDIVKTPVTYQKVKVQLKYINEDPIMKTPGTPDVKLERSPLLGLINKSEKGKDVAGTTLENSLQSSGQYSQKDVTSLLSPPSISFSSKSPFRNLEAGTKSTPVRIIGTPTSLQPKVAAIVKQFADFETNARSSPSPVTLKQKGNKTRWSSKFSNHKRSLGLNSTKKLKRLSKRSIGPQRRSKSVSKAQIVTISKQPIDEVDPVEAKDDYLGLQMDKSEPVKCLFPDEERNPKDGEFPHDSGINSLTSSSMDTLNESKQQLRKTFDLKLSESMRIVSKEIDISLEPANYTVLDKEQQPATQAPASCNENSSQPIKRMTYDVDYSSLSLKSIEVMIEESGDICSSEEGHEAFSHTIKDPPSPKKNNERVEGSPTENQVTRKDHSKSPEVLHADDVRNDATAISPCETSDQAASTPSKGGPKIVKGLRPGNILSGAISSFIKKVNTPKKETEEDKKRLKEKDMIKKEKVRQRNLEMIERKRREEMEERKRRREERERRVAESQAIKAREEEEKKRALEERLKNVRDKEEKARRVKEKEEEIKRKIRERKQAEVEARRKQEEEERKQKLLELEMEEKRKEEYLAKKAEYEEQYRAKRLADMKRLEEQKLQDIENERRLQEERWRREIEEKTKRQEEAERKLREDREKERLRKEKEEKERRAAIEKERKHDTESQRTIGKPPVVDNREEKEVKRLADVKEKHPRLEKEKEAREEKEKIERELLKKETEQLSRYYTPTLQGNLASQNKGKEHEMLKVVSKWIGDSNASSLLSVPLSDHRTNSVLSTSNVGANLGKSLVTPVHKSHVMAPPENKRPPAPPIPMPRESSYVCYNIADMESDDSTDEEDDPMQRVPSWAHKQRLWRALRNPDYAQLDPDKIFQGLLQPPKLELIFKKHTARFFKRTSSACWDSPILKNARKMV